MKPLFFAFISLLSCSTLLAQDRNYSISGVITDEKTRQPLPGASVFCQNTTIGTTTNNDGKFFLRLSNGGYDLVVSYTGYETKVIRVSNKDSNQYNVELKEEDKTMAEVVVAGSAEVADGWTKYGQFFLANFVGTTPNSAQCTIENKDAIKFYFYKKRNKLKVKSKEDILISNDALGYKIKYQLDSFVYDYNTNVSSYTGYPLFEEMQGTEEQKLNWKKQRYRSYLGSRLHFMRSWYDSTLNDEGFDLELLDANNKATAITEPYSSTIYMSDSGEAEINLKGRIRISYRNQVPDKKYLAQNKFPSNARVQVSALDVQDGFVIEENGYFYEQSEVTNIGYWAWKKLAELLPYDYNPD